MAVLHNQIVGVEEVQPLTDIMNIKAVNRHILGPADIKSGLQIEHLDILERDTVRIEDPDSKIGRVSVDLGATGCCRIIGINPVCGVGDLAGY